ncbi:MAG: hypothetical protein HOE90_00355 [Bacteriovoracaceae bacterium]|jgi:hypothetical protein|nr:hypothetical protein [Bacteriovoracaceae bacterium]
MNIKALIGAMLLSASALSAVPLNPTKFRYQVFVDDSKWDVTDRTQVMDSQGAGTYSDPRDALINKEVGAKTTDSLLENLPNMVSPLLGSMSQMELGQKSAIEIGRDIMSEVSTQIRSKLQAIKKDSLTGGLRDVSVMLTPWNRFNKDKESYQMMKMSRNNWAANQMGFSSNRETPLKDVFSKNWVTNNNGYALNVGNPTSLGLVLKEMTRKSLPLFDESTPEFIKAPYLVPLLGLIKVTATPREVVAKLQMLVVFAPHKSKFGGEQASPLVNIDYIRIPEGTDNHSMSRVAAPEEFEYPHALITTQWSDKDKGQVQKINIKFGMFEQYNNMEREIKLFSDAPNWWKFTPYLQAQLKKYKKGTPVNIHFKEIDVEIDPTVSDVASSVKITAIKTAIDVEAVSGIKITLENGSPVNMAGKEIATAGNEMIKAMIVDSQNKVGELTGPLKQIFSSIKGGK